MFWKLVCETDELAAKVEKFLKVLILIVLEVSLWGQLKLASPDAYEVLILIVLEVSLWDENNSKNSKRNHVLILIVLEVSLWDIPIVSYSSLNT